MTIDPAPETDARPASDGGEATIDAASVTEASDAPDLEEAEDAAGGEVAEAEADVTTVVPVSPTESVPDEPPSQATPGAAVVVGAEATEARRRRPKRVKARQVQRVVTRVDPWSMLKVSLLFALSLWLIVVVAGVLIWRVAVSTGTIPKFENFLAQTLGEDTFTINGGQIFQGSIVIGLVFFVTGAVFAVVTSVLFNLIAGVVGGVRFTMVELETARPVEEPTDAP